MTAFASWPRVPRVLLLVGGLLFLSGQALLVSSFFQGTPGDAATIPAGPQWYFVYEIKVLGASRLAGQFADPAGGLLKLYVLGETEYLVYSIIGIPRTLYAAGGASGSFVAELPGAGTYYLVLAHGDGSEDTTQAARVSYRVAGIQPDFIGVGTAFIVAGIAGVAIGLRWRDGRARAAAPA